MPISIWRHFHFPAAHLSNLTSSAERCHKRDATSWSECSLRCRVHKNVMIVMSVNSDFYEQRIRNYVLTVWENVASWHSRQNNFQTPPLSRNSPLGTQKSAHLAWGTLFLYYCVQAFRTCCFFQEQTRQSLTGVALHEKGSCWPPSCRV